jgi:DDE superfamily endonuclease
VGVLDQIGSHKSHDLCAHWQRRSDRFSPFTLPAYAPPLNLLGRRWRYLKAK